MDKGVLITVIIVALVIIGLIIGFVSFGEQEVQPDNQDIVSFGSDVFIDESQVEGGMDFQGSYTVEITSSGFSPKTLEINQEESVTFTNLGTASSWPASAIHPTHTVYPNSNINKCGTGEQGNIFDACKGLSSGGSYTFTFNEKGTWNYHDHLRPSNTGTIIVD